MRVALYGVGSLVAGIALYVGAVGIRLNYYDEQPGPGWLIALLFVAVALAVAGLLTLVSLAVRVSRERR